MTSTSRYYVHRRDPNYRIGECNNNNNNNNNETRDTRQERDERKSVLINIMTEKILEFRATGLLHPSSVVLLLV